MGKVTIRGESVRQQAIDLVVAGATFEEAAAITGYGADYVRQLCTKAGVWTPRFHKGINKNKIKADMKRAEKAQVYVAAAAYKSEGHTHREVAEKFGFSKATSYKIAKGIAPQRPENNPNIKYRNQFSDIDQTERVSALVAEKHPGFEYAGNYTGSSGSAEIRCKECGTVTTRNWHSVRMSKKLTCPVCESREREAARLSRELAKEDEKKRKALDKEEQRRKKLLTIKTEQISMSVCPVCQSFFVGRGKYCSNECAMKVRNAHHKDKRLRRIKSLMIDTDITLAGVAVLDANVCWLCGMLVDWNDIEERDGIKIAGDYYPSIDHVVPIASGGLHSWDNVRLAHRRCNYLKRDKAIAPHSPQCG